MKRGTMIAGVFFLLGVCVVPALAAPEPTLAAELVALREASSSQITDEARRVMAEAEASLRTGGVVDRAMSVGRRCPLFELADQNGKTVRMYELLEQGPIVLVFYRGGWCPYCNLQLKAMEAVADEIRGMGGALLAVTPDSQSGVREMVQKHKLSFPVLVDKENRVSRAFGLVYTLSPKLDTLYKSMGIDVRARNKSEQCELPLAATYVIGRNGVVAYAFLDEAYYRRAEPADVVAAVRRLMGETP
jgi:peroxiredoxin